MIGDNKGTPGAAGKDLVIEASAQHWKNPLRIKFQRREGKVKILVDGHHFKITIFWFSFVLFPIQNFPIWLKKTITKSWLEYKALILNRNSIQK